eukprot:11423295-Heterocapsa_arctica.AAC.1
MWEHPPVLFQMARLICNDLLQIDIMPGRRKVLLSEVSWARSKDWVTPYAAAMQRGHPGFLGSQLMGRIIR